MSSMVRSRARSRGVGGFPEGALAVCGMVASIPQTRAVSTNVSTALDSCRDWRHSDFREHCSQNEAEPAGQTQAGSRRLNPAKVSTQCPSPNPPRSRPRHCTSSLAPAPVGWTVAETARRSGPPGKGAHPIRQRARSPADREAGSGRVRPCTARRAVPRRHGRVPLHPRLAVQRQGLGGGTAPAPSRPSWPRRARPAPSSSSRRACTPTASPTGR